MRVRVTGISMEAEVLHILNVSIAFPVCNAHAPYYVLCILSGSTVIFHIISQKAWLSGGEKKDIEQKMYFDFLYKLRLNYFLF
jgi:hypothetical protein